ncbi:MAG: glycine cleavage system protein GcvH [candidate division WOR-3 bacterium]
MHIPEDLKYTKEHEWVKIEGETATVGITDFAQSELSDIVYVEPPSVGQEVTQFEPCGTIEAVKTVADIFSPLSGEVIEVNEELESEPGIINSDPYGHGWIFKIRIKDPEEIKNLLSAEEYKKHIGES